MDSTKKMVVRIVAAAIFLILYGAGPGLAGTFMDMQPGVSTKTDADKALGPPVKEVVKGIQYDYKPQLESRRLSIRFQKVSRVIESIDIYSQEPYTKTQYREWLQLGQPEKTGRDGSGNLVEYYTVAGVALHFSGPDDASAIEFFSHYNPATSTVQTPPRPRPKDEAYYVGESDKALEAKEWLQAKQIIEDGLRSYPNSADLWHHRALYYFRSKAEPRELRGIETARSMERAYRLNPSAKNAAEMGWIFRELRKDCYRALTYFEEAEAKGYARENKALLYWMGWCYEIVKDIPRARTYYQRFVDEATEDELAEDAKDRLRWIK